MFDLEPAAGRIRDLVTGITEEQLGSPTPCVDMRVGDLLDHIVGLSLAFQRAAEKRTSAAEGPPPEPAAENLPADWRTELDQRLVGLVAAWQDPRAWEGMTAVGGAEIPANEVGLVGLDELVLHGWDLARATGQEYVCPDADAEACYAFVSQVPADDAEARAGLFGPVVAVADDAPLFDRALALSGRDPNWTR